MTIWDRRFPVGVLRRVGPFSYMRFIQAIDLPPVFDFVFRSPWKGPLGFTLVLPENLQIKKNRSLRLLYVPTAGLEPATNGLGSRCSIRLSYVGNILSS